MVTREKMDWFDLTEEDAQKRRSALKTLLETFDVPSRRLDLDLSNLKWLGRNLKINNSENPMIDTAFRLITWLTRWEQRKIA
jgi:hypothetical protein